MRSAGVRSLSIAVLLMFALPAFGGGLTGKGFTAAFQNSGIHNPSIGQESINSYAVGLVSEWSFTDRLSFQPELTYDVRGFRRESFPGDKTDYQYHFIMGTALAKLTESEGIVRPSVFTGLEIGWMVEATIDGETYRGLLSQTDRQHYGLVLGMGLDGPLGHGRWMVDARYCVGLNDLESEDAEWSVQPSDRLRTLMVSFKILYGTDPYG
ncbi:outer membrane beta-barrel protein [bacterium]|nr:outer membrane beta-barrel protein [bacterium]